MASARQPDRLRQAALSAVWAVLLAAIVLLTLLGHNRLTDWDEGIYAQISREMLSTGWLTLHWNTRLWLEKPPLTFWITTLFFKLFGVSEFTARLGSALSAVALVGLLHGWLALRRNRLTAWLSTLIPLTTFGFLHAARVGETDILLSFGCLLAIIGLAEVQRNTNRSNLGWYLYWIGFAIALMSKGAASGTLLFTLIALTALDPNLLRRTGRHFALGFLLFLALVLPWHLYMLHRFGQLFVDQYFDLHVLGRATGQIEGHISRWWYYLRVLLVSAPPYVLLYPIALYDTFHQPRLRIFRAFALFALIQVIAFSFVQTRLPHYIAPCYAAFSALVAIWLAGHLHTYASRHPAAARTKLAAAAASTGVALWIIAALITAHPRSLLHSPRLPNGTVTPNNREEVALLMQVFRHPQPFIAATPGPLLDWRTGSYNPIPSVIFYANRLVQQVQLQPLPPNTPIDIYAFNPIPLSQAVTTQPRLLLITRSLIPQIPAQFAFHPIAASKTLEIGSISRRPYPRPESLTRPPLSR